MDLIDTPDTAALTDIPEISPEEFEEGFGETLQRTLDVDTWSTGEDLGEVYTRIQREVQEAVGKENEYRAVVQRELFPRLAAMRGAPKGAGVFPIYPDVIRRIHTGLLFNGGVEAADGTQQTHDTLPLTIFQIGVSLVSYQGSQGIWSQRLYRRDLRVVSRDPIEEVFELLEQRERRSALNHESRRDTLSELARRGIMAHAERAILLERSNATWRMGHGSIAPYELITGAGNLDLMVEGTKVLRRMIEEHQKFIYVASEPADRILLTIGDALGPLEYAVVGTLRDAIYRIVEHGHYRMKVSVDMTWDGVKVARPEEWIKRFRDEVASQVVVGVYRASRLAPPQVFYAHQDHADMAAHIAAADSILQAHRGFPQLIDLADYVCRGVFGADTLRGPVTSAYIDAGAPYRFLSERQTRYQ